MPAPTPARLDSRDRLWRSSRRGQREVESGEIALAKVQCLRLIAENGFLYARMLGDGRCVYLAPAPADWNKILLGIARNMASHSYYAVWEFPPRDDAMWRAALGWDGNGEPEGFIRCLVHPDQHASPP